MIRAPLPPSAPSPLPGLPTFKKTPFCISPCSLHQIRIPCDGTGKILGSIKFEPIIASPREIGAKVAYIDRHFQHSNADIALGYILVKVNGVVVKTDSHSSILERIKNELRCVSSNQITLSFSCGANDGKARIVTSSSLARFKSEKQGTPILDRIREQKMSPHYVAHPRTSPLFKTTKEENNILVYPESHMDGEKYGKKIVDSSIDVSAHNLLANKGKLSSKFYSDSRNFIEDSQGVGSSGDQRKKTYGESRPTKAFEPPIVDNNVAPPKTCEDENIGNLSHSCTIELPPECTRMMPSLTPKPSEQVLHSIFSPMFDKIEGHFPQQSQLVQDTEESPVLRLQPHEWAANSGSASPWILPIISESIVESSPSTSSLVTKEPTSAESFLEMNSKPPFSVVSHSCGSSLSKEVEQDGEQVEQMPMLHTNAPSRYHSISLSTAEMDFSSLREELPSMSQDRIKSFRQQDHFSEIPTQIHCQEKIMLTPNETLPTPKGKNDNCTLFSESCRQNKSATSHRSSPPLPSFTMDNFFSPENINHSTMLEDGTGIQYMHQLSRINLANENKSIDDNVPFLSPYSTQTEAVIPVSQSKTPPGKPQKLPMKMLNFDFINQCESAELLHTILTTLREGDNSYPALTRIAVNRLKMIEQQSLSEGNMCSNENALSVNTSETQAERKNAGTPSTVDSFNTCKSIGTFENVEDCLSDDEETGFIVKTFLTDTSDLSVLDNNENHLGVDTPLSPSPSMSESIYSIASSVLAFENSFSNVSDCRQIPAQPTTPSNFIFESNRSLQPTASFSISSSKICGDTDDDTSAVSITPSTLIFEAHRNFQQGLPPSSESFDSILDKSIITGESMCNTSETKGSISSYFTEHLSLASIEHSTVHEEESAYSWKHSKTKIQRNPKLPSIHELEDNLATALTSHSLLTFEMQSVLQEKNAVNKDLSMQVNYLTFKLRTLQMTVSTQTNAYSTKIRSLEMAKYNAEQDAILLEETVVDSSAKAAEITTNLRNQKSMVQHLEAKLRSEKESMTRALQESEIEKDELRQKVTDLSHLLSLKEKKAEHVERLLRNELGVKQEEVDELRQQLNDARHFIERLQHERHNAKKTTEALTTAVEQGKKYKDMYNDMSKQAALAEANAKDMANDLALTEANMTEAIEICNKKHLRFISLLEENHQVENEKKKLTVHAENLNKELTSCHAIINQLRSQRASKSSEVAQLEPEKDITTADLYENAVQKAQKYGKEMQNNTNEAKHHTLKVEKLEDNLSKKDALHIVHKKQPLKSWKKKSSNDKENIACSQHELLAPFNSSNIIIHKDIEKNVDAKENHHFGKLDKNLKETRRTTSRQMSLRAAGGRAALKEKLKMARGSTVKKQQQQQLLAVR